MSFLLSTAVSAEPVEHRPVSVRLELIAYEESVVGVLLNFLDVKIARYHVVSAKPFGFLHVHVIFFERDMSGKLVETDRLETSCMFVQSGIRTATLSFLLSPTKAFVSLAGSPGDSKETRFLQKMKGSTRIGVGARIVGTSVVKSKFIACILAQEEVKAKS